MYEVYISYADEDEKIAGDICKLFEENGYSCWYKKRDYKENDSVSKISQAIRDSKRFVLVYSKSAEDSNFIRTEIDIGFADDLPIIIFNIDGTDISPQLQFYLENKPLIDAHPDTENHYEQLLKDTAQLVASSKSETDEYDAYICYAEEDGLTGDAICHVLESNNIKCWFKNRDFKVNDSLKKINETIKNSKSVVLIYSEDAKKSNFVKTELEIANSSGIPIISFKIDESTHDEFKSLNDAHWLEAFPNPGKTFKDLVSEVSNIVGKNIDDPQISKEYEDLKVDKKAKPKVATKKEDISQDFEKDYGISKNFKKIAIGVIAIMAVILLVVYLSNYIFMPNLTDDHLVISDGDVKIDSVPDQLAMTIDAADISSDNCHVEFTVEKKPDDFDDYTAHISFLDDSKRVVDEYEAPIKDLKKGDKGEFEMDYKTTYDGVTAYFSISNPGKTLVTDNEKIGDIS